VQGFSAIRQPPKSDSWGVAVERTEVHNLNHREQASMNHREQASIERIQMKPALEKLIPPDGCSFRCFDRSILKTTVRWHRHPELEINFVEKGCGTRLVGDHIGEYEDGDLVMLGANLPHTWMSDEFIGEKYDRHPSIVLQFLPDHFETIFDLPEMDSVKRLITRSKRGLWFRGPDAQSVGQKIKELIDTKGGFRLVGLLNCLVELARIEDVTQMATVSYTSSFDQSSDVRIQVVCEYINSNLTNSQLDLGEIPKLVEMNPSAFSRYFKKTTGRTLTRYVNELRIGLACRKLTDTQRTILDISFEVGFGNLSNFNRRFREIKGVTPRQFRKKAVDALSSDN
jgi:AraC-like DNA-binding protein